MPVWKSAGRMVAYDASASGRTLLRRYDADVAIGRKSATYDDNAARPVTAHPYDHSAAIRPQNTMAVRSDVQKPYDANLMKSTMSKKFVTPSATSPATPLTSAFKSSACPSTTPCARSPAHKTTAGVVALRRQSGQNPGKSQKTGFTMAVWKSTG